MRIRSLLKSIGFLALLCFGSLSLAQLPTATLSGRVSHEGGGLPGVSVTAKSPALQGARTTVTSSSGDYVFVTMPPGDYTVTFTLSGFQSLTKTVKLSATQVSQLDAVMSITAIAAQATVVGKTESISMTSAGATTYTSELLNVLPTPRTIQGGVNLSPGLNNNAPNGISISGAQSTETLYTVNGVVITDNVRSTPVNNLYIEDAIQEITTQTSTVSAEYGRFTGGMVNAVTKAGGNTFSGSVRSTLSNDAWNATSNYTDPVTGKNPQEGIFLNKVVPTWEATLGGPLWKDRIWFFGAGRFYDKSEASTGTTRQTNIPYTTGDKEYRYEGKLTLSPLTNHTLTASYIHAKIDQNNYFFPSVPAADLASIYDRQQPTDLLAVNYNGVLTDWLFLEGQYSKKQFTFENSGGRYTDFVQGTVIRDLSRAVGMNSPYFCAVCGPPETRDNNNWLVKTNWFVSSPTLGSHNIVFGYDDFGAQRFSNNNQSGSNYVVYQQTPSIIQGQNIYPVFSESTELDWWPVLSPSLGSDVRTRSFFLNDTWRLSNRFSFNLGVRYDKNDAVDMAGNVTSDDSAFSPRLAAVFDVMGDGKLRVTASYARYVAALQETQAGSGATVAGTPADFWWYYDGPGINTDPSQPLLSSQAALAELENWFRSRGCLPDPLSPNCTVPLDGSNISGVNQQIRDPLRSPHANEFVVGVNGQIGKRGTFRADFIRREFKDYYDLKRDMSTGQVTNPISGAALDLGLIVNSNDYKREYTGLNTQFAYRFGDRFNVGGNWTWSHLIGSLVGETSGSGPTRGGLNDQPEYKEERWFAPSGDLSSDTRHRVRLYGTYMAPIPQNFGTLSLSFVEYWDSGNPYGASGAVDSRPYVTNPGYAVRPSSVTYWYTARDAFLTDDIFRTDLSLIYTYRIANTVEIYLAPIINNLFNSQHVQIVNQTVESRVTNQSSYAAFNPFTTIPTQGARGTGANWNYGPQFGQPTTPTHYQTPRYFIVSAGIRF